MVTLDGLVQVSVPEERSLPDGSGVFPLTLAPGQGAGPATASQLSAWTQRNAGALRALALSHGAVLLRGFGVESAEDFGTVAGALDCRGYEYIGGAAPRTELVPGLVFTSNESPPDQAIPFHHELAQAPEPPAYILFFCERPAAAGGATPIIHSAAVAAFFRARHPVFAEQVRRLGVRYIRVMPEVTDASSAQGRSWKETYNVTTRAEAEAAMRRQGTSCDWLPNGDCRATTAVLPALRVDRRTNQEVFFNSMVAALLGWNDSRNVGERAVVLGDGSPVDSAALHSVAEFMRQERVVFPWQKGDVLLIDNGLVMHSRDPFKPPRRVLASMRGPPIGAAVASEGVPAREVPGGVAAVAVRVGIIGSGAMGKEHIRNIALLGPDRARVVAVADSSADALREAVEELGAEAAGACEFFRDWRALLRSPRVDAVLLCTPNFQHVEVLRAAIPTGKHILCEKPLCTTVEDCLEVERLLQAREEEFPAGGLPVFMTGMEYRWMPPIARLIEETDSGRLGPVHTVTIREHRFPFLTKVDSWNRFNRYTGGTLVEKACHFFDLMRRITGSDPVAVYATGGQAVNHREELLDAGRPDIIDHAFAAVDFENGARAMLDLNMFAEDEQTEQVSAVCGLGKVEARSPESTVRILRRRHVAGLGRTPPLPAERAVPEWVSLPVPADLAAAGFHEGATYHELGAFLGAVNGGEAAPVSARDGRIAVMMGRAAQESIRTGRAVSLDVGRGVLGGAAARGRRALPAEAGGAHVHVPAATALDSPRARL